MKKFGKYVVWLVMLAFILSAFSACKKEGDTSDVSDTAFDSSAEVSDDGTSAGSEEPEETSEAAADEDGLDIYPLRGILSKDEKMYYDVFEKEFSGYATSVTFDTVDYESVEKAYKAFIKDHPEFFWLSGTYEYVWGQKQGKDYTDFAPIIYLTEEEIKEKQEVLESGISRILDSVPSGLSDYEIALYLHDTIIESTSYDNEAYEIVMSQTESGKFMPQSTAYGCICEGWAICSGYSSAYQLLLQREGITAGRVASVTHEWNYVVLDGDYYYADVTWDDPVSSDGTSDSLFHTYFMVTGEELFAEDEHTPSDDELFVPEAAAAKYNYYVYNGWYIETYDIDAAAKVIEGQYKSGTVEIRFSSESELEAALKDLFENKSIFDIVFSDGERFPSSVSYTKRGACLTIHLK